MKSWVILLITLLNKSINAGSMDNLSCVIIAFNNFISKQDSIIKTPIKIIKKIPSSLILGINWDRAISRTYVKRQATIENTELNNKNEMNK